MVALGFNPAAVSMVQSQSSSDSLAAPESEGEGTPRRALLAKRESFFSTGLVKNAGRAW